jgi:hypothetical protein
MASYELYGGEVTLDFNEGKHTYEVEGSKIPSVTGITGIIDKSGPLMWWAVKQCLSYVEDNLAAVQKMDEVELKRFWHDAQRSHFRASKEATDIGHLAHEWIEDWLNGKNPETPKNEKLRATTDSFVEWAIEAAVTPYETEFKIYSREHGYAGTADFDGMIGKDRCIVDWKTSKDIYPEYELQLTAYRLAREEELDVTYDAMYCVVMPKDGGKIKIKRYEPTQRAEDGFLGALALVQSLKKK